MNQFDPVRRDGKSMALELARIWDELLTRPGLSPEVDFRLRRMINRLNPILDRIFLKTVKAQEMIQECASRTEELETRLTAPGDSVYYWLTQVEKTHEELLHKTYEFRVKAG